MDPEIRALTNQSRIVLPFRAASSMYDHMAAWSFFPGGEHMARWILDNPHIVHGRPVIDIGSGSGAVAIAAAISGASSVEAWDQDTRAISIIHENAALNNVRVTAVERTLHSLDQLAGFTGVVCAADIFYFEDSRNEELLLEASRDDMDMLVASYDSELEGFRGIARNVSALPCSSQPHVYVRMFHKPRV